MKFNVLKFKLGGAKLGEIWWTSVQDSDVPILLSSNDFYEFLGVWGRLLEIGN
jgi:hypothetical protein